MTTITISITIPDGASVTVDGGTVTVPAAAIPQGYTPLEAEESGWECPIHHAVKTVPAGVSQKTGKPYSSFKACPERGCDEKPPR